MPPIRTFLFAAIVSSQFCLADENWPVWRGPRGDGTVENAPNLPTAFDITTDTVWKTPIDGIGHASPIIRENRIFLVSANEEKETRSLSESLDSGVDY